jgi:hypothetical protein
MGMGKDNSAIQDSVRCVDNDGDIVVTYLVSSKSVHVAVPRLAYCSRAKPYALRIMSRAPPFPTNSTRRPRSPAADVTDSIRDSYSQPTRPLQINRARQPPPDVKTLPSGPLGAAPNGPYRPQRSELRARQPSENIANSVVQDSVVAAGDRRRQIKNGVEERRVPTNRLNGPARAGNIDGMLSFNVREHVVIRGGIHSCPRSDKGWVGVRH